MCSILDKRAKDILIANDKGTYTVPTKGLYPYQWNWDSALVALGFSTFDIPRACQEVESLLEAQWDDGFVPHIIFRGNAPGYFPGPVVWKAGQRTPSSGITQPPVAASVVLTLWQATDDQAIRQRLAALFPRLLNWHRWFNEFRVTAKGGVVISHPWESGRDNSVEWDEPAARVDTSGIGDYKRRDLEYTDADMRPTKLDYDRYLAMVAYGRESGWDHRKIAEQGPFRVADVGMTMIFLRASRDLATLAALLDETEAGQEIQGHIDHLINNMDYLWDDENGVFCSRDLISGKLSGQVTNASFLNFYGDAGTPQQRQRMAEHWQRIAARVKYTVPSQDPDSEAFDAIRYWRGPVWAIMNYMIAKGFREQGREDWAERVKLDTRTLMEKTGFYEAYSPEDGSGSGGNEFSWTAAMWLTWCGK